jgi:hypothetical protein
VFQLNSVNGLTFVMVRVITDVLYT